MKLGLDPIQVQGPLHAFVPPRFRGEQADDFDLPIHDLFLEHCVEGSEPGQLIIKSGRGGGLTTCLQWLKNWLKSYNKCEGSALEIFDLAALNGPDCAFVAERLKNGSAVLFADLSLLPFHPKAEESFHSLMTDGLPIDGHTVLRLQSCRMVLATSESLFEGHWFESLENGRRVQLAPWSRDDWIELLGSTPVLCERRKELFPQLDALRAKLRDLGTPRTAIWLLEAALSCRKNTAITVADLFAEVLDKLPLNVIRMLRKMDGDLAFEADIKQSLIDEVLSFEEVLTYFQVSVFDAEDFFKTAEDRCPPGLSIFQSAESFQRLVPFALTGLGDFMHAGLQLKAIVDDDVVWPLRPESFSFIKEMISEGHLAQLRRWLQEQDSGRKKVSVAATLLWHLGEVPNIDPAKRSYLFFEALLSGVPWERRNLSGLHFLSCGLTKASFRGSKLAMTLMCGTSLQEVDFEDCDLDQARFAECSLQGSQFIRSKLSKAEFARSSLDGSNFESALLCLSYFNACSVTGVQFNDCEFGGAAFKLIDFRDCVIKDSLFNTVNFEQCNFSFVDLINFGGSRTQFRKSDLSNTNFSGSRLDRSQFIHCRANEINFHGANLKEAIFDGVNFHAGSSRCGMLTDKPALEGNMTQYYVENQLEDAWVSPESVRHANFSGADLRGAKFMNTNLFRVDFRGALLDKDLVEQARKHKAILDDH